MATVYLHKSTLQTLLEAKPDIDIQNKDGYTPLHVAVFAGELASDHLNREILELLLSKRANPFKEDDYKSTRRRLVESLR